MTKTSTKRRLGKGAASARPAAKDETLHTDVLIVGAGFVGGTLACALADGGMDVIAVDHADPKANLRPEFDGRVSAIALACQRVLDGVGLWAGMAGDCAPILDIRVTDKDSLCFLHYDHRDGIGEPFGYMVENRLFRQVLFKRLGKLKGARLLAPAAVVATERHSSGVEAVLADGRKVKARLVVGADGRTSATRQAAAIKLTKWSYHQTAIVCTVAHEKPHDFIAHEHFLPSGPFAILPMMGNRSAIVWTEREDLASAIMELNKAGFLDELGRRFGDFLGSIQVIGKRWAYPLSLQYAETATAQRLALAGDAAHGMHPIAGQGLNMGLRDVAVLAEVLIDARRLGLDVGGTQVLPRYARWRRFDNVLMLAMTDVLNRLFSNDFRPLVLARDGGLAAVNRLPPLKRLFMRQAMGLVGDLPRLMRGQAL